MKIKNDHHKKMKLNKLWHVAITLLLLPLLFLTSCKKEKPGQFNKATQTVFQYISTAKQLDLYRAALKRAGMYSADTFSNGGSFTVFAPVDSAFTNAGLTLDSINRYDPQALALVLKYNIVYGQISSSTLIGFYSEAATCLNPTYKPTITKNYYGIFFNGIPLVTTGSLTLNDGVIHELRRMAFPPGVNLFQLISQTPDLTLFTAAIKLIGYNTKLSAPPGNLGPQMTVFAPTDAAFKEFGYPDINSINNADPSFLQTLIDNYIFGQEFFTSGFIGGFSFNYNFYYVEPDGLTILTQGNVDPIHIIRPDVLATNGVLQVVDQVIVVR